MQIYDKKTVTCCSYYLYWLYNQGNKKNNGLNPITSEGHMARYVASGDLDVHEFVDADTLEKVEAYCEKH